MKSLPLPPELLERIAGSWIRKRALCSRPTDSSKRMPASGFVLYRRFTLIYLHKEAVFSSIDLDYGALNPKP